MKQTNININSTNYYNNELLRIIKGALDLDVDKVRNYTVFLADKIEQEGDKFTAERLRKVLNGSDHQLKPTGVKFAEPVPVDAESRFPLIERVELKNIDEQPIILLPEQWEIVNEFLNISKSHALLDSEGIGGSVSLLMCGPPGTGKSRLARHIAKELKMELYIARLDGLISSLLGSTSKNIRALFDFASKRPCILFLDEFDAIAKLRGDSLEMGELKRVVNSFIQNLDSFGTQSIILAATNHEGLLDSAVWRRFSYRLEFSFPNNQLRKQMWSQFIKPIEFNNRDLELLVDLSEGFSGSDIQEVCRRLQRRQITMKDGSNLKDAFQILRNISIGEGEERRFLSSFRGQDSRQIAIALNNRNKKLYNNDSLAKLIGTTYIMAYRWTREGGKTS
jgi:ATP-dependent 26S proteasome regulatory subunit